MFPNPATDRIMINLSEWKSQPSLSDLQINDHVGRSYPVRAIWHEVTRDLEFDLSNLESDVSARLYDTRQFL